MSTVLPPQQRSSGDTSATLPPTIHERRASNQQSAINRLHIELLQSIFLLCTSQPQGADGVEQWNGESDEDGADTSDSNSDDDGSSAEGQNGEEGVDSDEEGVDSDEDGEDEGSDSDDSQEEDSSTETDDGQERDEFYIPKDSLGIEPRSDRMRRAVASVCSWWRQVALNYPHFWASIGDRLVKHLGRDYRLDDGKYLALCAERSRVVPIDLYFIYPKTRASSSRFSGFYTGDISFASTQRIKEETWRIVEAISVLQSCFSQVRTLAVRASSIAIANFILPQLQTMTSISSICLEPSDLESDVTFTKFPFTSTTLKTLALVEWTMEGENLQALIHGFPSLRDLRLCPTVEPDDNLPPIEPIQAPHLTYLYLNLNHTRLTPRMFVTHNLTYLSLYYDRSKEEDSSISGEFWPSWSTEVEGWSEEIYAEGKPYFPALERARFASMSGSVDRTFRDVVCKIVRCHPQLQAIEFVSVDRAVDDFIKMFGTDMEGEIEWKISSALREIVIQWGRRFILEEEERARARGSGPPRIGSFPMLWKTIVSKLLEHSEDLKVTLKNGYYPSLEFWSLLSQEYKPRLQLLDQGTASS